MVRFLVLYGKPINSEAFDRHYREIHIPLTKQLAGLQRFTLSRNVSMRRGDDPYHLVVELEWESMDTFRQAFQTPEGQAVADDVTNFLSKLCPNVQSLTYETEEA